MTAWTLSVFTICRWQRWLVFPEITSASTQNWWLTVQRSSHGQRGAAWTISILSNKKYDMEFRDGHAMSIDADIRIIRHMLDIARYCRIMRKLMQISASTWPSLIFMLEITHYWRNGQILNKWLLYTYTYKPQCRLCPRELSAELETQLPQCPNWDVLCYHWPCIYKRRCVFNYLVFVFSIWNTWDNWLCDFLWPG